MKRTAPITPTPYRVVAHIDALVAEGRITRGHTRDRVFSHEPDARVFADKCRQDGAHAVLIWHYEEGRWEDLDVWYEH